MANIQALKMQTIERHSNANIKRDCMNMNRGTKKNEAAITINLSAVRPNHDHIVTFKCGLLQSTIYSYKSHNPTN